MRKWFMTLAVLGAGGIGAFLLTDKGRQSLRRFLQEFDDASDRRWGEWNESAEAELEGIRATLSQIAQSLEPHGDPGPESAPARF
jgi:hypothetical protein